MVAESSFGRLRAIAVALVAAVSLALMPRPAAAQNATSFIADLGNQATQALRLPPAERAAQFRHIFSSDFDLDGAARFVMGPHWRGLTPAQQQQFLPLFRDYLAQSYSSRLSQYAGDPFRVTGSRPNGAETIVSSQVMRRSGKPIEMDWHVINSGGRFLVSDVYVDGVSMRLTHRQEFASIIQRNGGRPDALLAALRQQLSQTATQVGSSQPEPATQYQPRPANQNEPGPANQYQSVPAYGR